MRAAATVYVIMSVEIEAPPERVWEPPHVFGFTMVSGGSFKSHDERWEIEATATGSRFTFNDRIEFPYGPLGSVMGWFATRQAQATGDQALAELKLLADAPNRERVSAGQARLAKPAAFMGSRMRLRSDMPSP